MTGEKLTEEAIAALEARAKRYYETDGRNLLLAVYPSGVKTWISRVRWLGRDVDTGLGRWPAVSAAEARRRHEEIRARVQAGRNPRSLDVKTFADLWNEWFKTQRQGWDPGYADEVQSRGRMYILRAFGQAKPSKIQLIDIKERFEKLYAEKPETCKKVLGYLCQCLSYGAVFGICRAVKPSDIHVAFPPKARKVVHYPAVVEPSEIGRLIRLCRGYPYSPFIRAALLFTAWTAGRAQEIAGARWEEIDMEQALWTVPACRMKRRQEHAVPLPRQCMDMLRELGAGADGHPFLFPSARSKARHVSKESLLVAIRDLGYAKEQMTLHGFRTTFSTTANASGLWDADLVEAQLSHAPGNAVRAAYNRTVYLERRREMMQWYADLLDALAAGRRDVSIQSRTFE